MKYLFITFFIVFIVIAISGCTPAVPPEETPTIPQEPVSVAEIIKYDAYAGLVNAIAGELANMADSYTAEFGSDAVVYIESGFSGCKLPETTIPEVLNSASVYAPAEPFFTELDGAFLIMEPILRLYAETYASAVEYYGSGAYIEDEFKHAKQYHDVLSGTWNEVFVSAEAFLTEFYALTEDFDTRLLRYYEEANYPLHRNMLAAVRAAESFVTYLDKNRIVTSSQDMDTTSLSAMYNDFDGVAEAWFLIDTETTEQREGLGDTHAFNEALRNMLTAAGAFTQAVENASDNIKTAAALREFCNALIIEYNALIETAGGSVRASLELPTQGTFLGLSPQTPS